MYIFRILVHSDMRKEMLAGALSTAPASVVEDHSVHVSALCGNREISSWPVAYPTGSHWEGKEPTDDVRMREVRLRQTTEETCEQARHVSCGAGKPRGGPGGSARQQPARQAQYWETCPRSWTRTTSSKLRKKERLTALLHHVTVEFLGKGVLSGAA